MPFRCPMDCRMAYVSCKAYPAAALTGEGAVEEHKQELPRQTGGVTGSHQNWRMGETREGVAQKGTTGR